MINSRRSDNARRLLGALYRHSDDTSVLLLARILDYNSEQLKIDLFDIQEYVHELEDFYKDQV